MNSYKTIVYIVGTIALVIYFVLPEYEKMNRVSQSIAEYSSVLANASSYNTTLKSNLMRINTLPEHDVVKLSRMVQSDGIHPSQTLYNLDVLAQRLGLTTTDVSMTEPQYPRSGGEGAGMKSADITANDFYTQDFDIKLTGTYAQFKQFIESVEKSVTPLVVVHTKFGSESGIASVFSFEVRVRTFALIGVK